MPVRRPKNRLPGEGAGTVAASITRSNLIGPAQGFLLAVDDGGELLVLGSERVTFGHASAGRADVGFLADLEPLALAIEWRSSLRGGGAYWALPLESGPRLNGEQLEAEGAPLTSGARLEIAHNLTAVARVPDPASASVLLELEGSSERNGIRRLLLFAPGPMGRLSIGPSRLRHVPIRGLALEVSLIRDKTRLRVDAQRSGDDPSTSSEEHFVLPFPPRERVDLELGRARGNRPPFGLAVVPTASSGLQRGAGMTGQDANRGSA